MKPTLFLAGVLVAGLFACTNPRPVAEPSPAAQAAFERSYWAYVQCIEGRAGPQIRDFVARGLGHITVRVEDAAAYCRAELIDVAYSYRARAFSPDTLSSLSDDELQRRMRALVSVVVIGGYAQEYGVRQPGLRHPDQLPDSPR